MSLWQNVFHKQKTNQMRFHDLRHTAASNMAKSAINPIVAVTVLGMRFDTYQKTYLKLSIEDLVVASESNFARLGGSMFDAKGGVGFSVGWLPIFYYVVDFLSGRVTEVVVCTRRTTKLKSTIKSTSKLVKQKHFFKLILFYKQKTHMRLNAQAPLSNYLWRVGFVWDALFQPWRSSPA